jgi:UDP-3-O-[3-hydroxymyristoyl] glucosamine N-acyltransferase
MKLSKLCQEIDINFNSQDIEIIGLNTLTQSTPSQISFFTDKKYINQLPSTKAGAVFISQEFAHHLPKSTIALITDESYLKIAQSSKFFTHKLDITSSSVEIGNNSNIDKSVGLGRGIVVGDNVTIMYGAYIGDNVTIGDNSIINPNTTIYHHTKIGKNCIIHSGTVIGCDGYGFAHTKDGRHIKIYQNGNVEIEDDVEIGANCSIDRAVFGTTYIRKGTKFDNLIHIGHNCDIGENTLLTAQVGMAGSSILERNVVMGGQSAVAGHLTIGAFSTIAGKSGVTKSLKGNNNYAGFPAIEHKRWLKIQAKISKLIKG